nr:RNA-dependent RNA polymerase [Tolivirales sp.]
MGLEADHFMSIVSLDGELDLSSPFQTTTSTVHLSHKSKRPSVVLGPHSFGDKWKVPKTGFYTPTDVSFVVTPHISENAGVTAVVTLIDVSDLSPTRVLYRSQEFNLGHGLTLEGSQLPFCLPVGEYPILFEVTVSRSQFAATRTMFSTSLEWRMQWSPTPLSRVKSVFATAQVKALEATPSFKLKQKTENKSRGPRAANKLPHNRTSTPAIGGTSVGLVTDGCVGMAGPGQ